MARSHAKLAWRIGVGNYETDEAFARLLALIRDHRPIIDEVCLFETVTHHLYLPIDLLERRATRIAECLGAIRAEGVPSVGINVLTTLGHMNEGWDYMPALPFPAMVGHDGAVSLGCACPTSPELAVYLWRKYTLMAEARPDFLWVDDDIRMHHHGVAYACFCSHCLLRFAEETGLGHTRETLVAALSLPEQGELRGQWIAHNVRTIESLLSHVREAIDSVDPRIATGLMTAGPGWCTYSGVAFDRWFAALRATKSRPGGGFYSDDAPKGMIAKALEVGRQRQGLPESVGDRQYELENFPYQVLRKSSRTLVNECTLSLAAGMNGIAMNALGMGEGAFGDYGGHLARIAAARPMWEALVEHAEGLPTAGLWPVWTSTLMAERRVRPGEDWFALSGWYDTTRAYILAEIGLPLATDRPGCGVILTGRVAEGFGNESLIRMLSGGAILDTMALAVLEARGFADLAGVRIARRVTNGVAERFTGDPLNGPYAGELRDCRVEFWGDAMGQADVLEPTQEGVHILAEMENYFQEPYGPCLTAFENEHGGRVAVLGYAPWMFVHSAAKRTQLQNIADWVTRGACPVRIEETVPLVPFVRMSEDRARWLVVLLNAGFDEVPDATVRVRAPAGPVRALSEGGEVPACVAEGPGEQTIQLAPIAPWHVVCVLGG